MPFNHGFIVVVHQINLGMLLGCSPSEEVWLKDSSVMTLETDQRLPHRHDTPTTSHHAGAEPSKDGKVTEFTSEPSASTTRSQRHPDSSEDTMSDCDEARSILARLKAGETLVVNSRRRNGLVLCKPFHAEFAGPGAAVGGQLDVDCCRVIPVGNLSLVEPESYDDCQRAFKIRRQWIKLTQQFTDQPKPLQRAQMILNQFEAYFDAETIANIPDEAFARLVGVLPHTIRGARRRPVQVAVKMKT